MRIAPLPDKAFFLLSMAVTIICTLVSIACVYLAASGQKVVLTKFPRPELSVKSVPEPNTLLFSLNYKKDI
jgi:hypothetical protein